MYGDDSQSPAKASSSSGSNTSFYDYMYNRSNGDAESQSTKGKKRPFRRFVCEICDEDLSYEWVLKKHRMVHQPLDGKPLFYCPYSKCKVGYRASATMMKHLKKAHYEFATEYLVAVKLAKRKTNRTNRARKPESS